MIHYFNPGHEGAVLNTSPYYMMPASLVRLQVDLSFLPAWYAYSGDMVWVQQALPATYISHISKNLKMDILSITENQLKEYAHKEIMLWGISIQAIHTIKNINSTYELNLRLPTWHAQYVYLNGRRAGNDCLKNILNKITDLPTSLLPQFYSQLEDIEHAVSQSPWQLLAKSPYSSSGRGLLRLPIGELTRAERQILQGMLSKQKELSLEVLLDREIDFAMEFLSDENNQVQFVGYSLFKTSEKGAYQGNYLKHQTEIEKILEKYIPARTLERIKTTLIDELTNTYATVYKGCIGVDMLIYRVGNTFGIQPCVEINMRYNMGFLACRFTENYLAQTSSGFFYIDFDAQEGEAYQKQLQLQTEYPASFADNKLVEGYLPLCPVYQESKYSAYVIVKSNQ